MGNVFRGFGEGNKPLDDNLPHHHGNIGLFLVFFSYGGGKSETFSIKGGPRQIRGPGRKHEGEHNLCILRNQGSMLGKNRGGQQNIEKKKTRSKLMNF